MIIVKKPFMYLRDCHQWKYGSFSFNRAFMDLNRYMMFERRKNMTCETFMNSENKTTKDAGYIVITLEDFLQHSNHVDDILLSQYNIKAYWSFIFIRLGLKVVKNAEIVIPTKEAFPLIIRNERYNFYIACGYEELVINRFLDENY